MAIGIERDRTLVWHDGDLLQVGLEPSRATMIHGAPRSARAVVALVDASTDETELARRAAAAGLSQEELAASLHWLRQAGLIQDHAGHASSADAAAPASPWVEVSGPPGATEHLMESLSGLTIDGLRLSHAPYPSLAGPDVVVLAPWRGRDLPAACWLLSRDIVHLPVVRCDADVVIGPLVVPGLSACLECLERHRVDKDPRWPTTAATWDDPRRHEPDRPGRDALDAAAGRYAALLVDRVCRGEAASPVGVTTTLRADGEISQAIWPQHPECTCHWRLREVRT
jgi:hypothetical protein